MVHKKPLSRPTRMLFALVGLIAILTIYVFQQIDYLEYLHFGHFSTTTNFVFNRVVRLILNDLSCILIIHAIFTEPKYNKIAFMLFSIELFLILPIYLIAKLSIEGPTEISSPILSQIHRLIVNPMLMVVLIASFYYQKKFAPARG